MLHDLLQMAVYCALVMALAPVLGRYMHRVFAGERVVLTPAIQPVERAIYAACGVRPKRGEPGGCFWISTGTYI